MLAFCGEKKKNNSTKSELFIFERKVNAKPECFKYTLQIKKLTAEVEKLLTYNKL